MDHLPQQEETLVPLPHVAVQAAHKVLVQQVGHVQPQAVDGELLHPAAHAVQQVVHHRGILQVQLHQLVVALPALVPEAVVVAAVASKVDVEPVLIGGGLPLFLHVLEGPEAPAHVVEHAVQHHPDARLVQSVADLFKLLVGAQAAVDFFEIPGVVAVGVRLKHRGEIDGPNAQLLQVGDPLLHLLDAVHRHPVVLKGRAAKPHGVDLIKHSALGPVLFRLAMQHTRSSSFCGFRPEFHSATSIKHSPRKGNPFPEIFCALSLNFLTIQEVCCRTLLQEAPAFPL